MGAVLLHCLTLVDQCRNAENPKCVFTQVCLLARSREPRGRVGPWQLSSSCAWWWQGPVPALTSPPAIPEPL